MIEFFKKFFSKFSEKLVYITADGKNFASFHAASKHQSTLYANQFSAHIDQFRTSPDARTLREDPEEEQIDNGICGKPITIMNHAVTPTYTRPNDTITLEVFGEAIVSREIDRSMVINRATTFHFKDALGYEHAFGGIFGEASKDE